MIIQYIVYLYTAARVLNGHIKLYLWAHKTEISRGSCLCADEIYDTSSLTPPPSLLSADDH